MKPTISAKTFAITITTALALGIAPWAMADDKGCSVETLKGTFGYTSTGVILTAQIPALAGPGAEVGTQYFDGKGGVTFTFNSSQNGNISSGTVSGGYKVNDDCTGTFTEVETPMFTANFSFVIDKSGDEFQAICQDFGRR